MALSKKMLHEKLRKEYIEQIKTYLSEKGEEVLVTASNELCVPCVDEEGNDEYLVIVFKVPTGDREGTAYDGYSMAEDYARKSAEKAEKAEKAKAIKQAKIERDKAEREAKAKAKAEHKANKA